MDREQYIKNLKDALKKSFTQQQTNDILADYSEFFDAGLAEGKSESELCTEFGSPEKVTMELLGSNIRKQKQWTTQTCLSCIFTAMGFILLLLFPFLAHNSSFSLSAYLFPLPLILQAIILVGNAKSTEISADTSKLFQMRQSWLSGWPLYVSVLLSSIFFGYYLSYDFIWRLPSNGDILGYTVILIILAFIYLIRSAYPIKTEKLRGIKTILILSYFLIAALITALVFFISKQNALLMNKSSSENELEYVIYAIGNLSAIIFTLTVFTGILITIQKNTKLKWLIFLNTTLLSLILNFIVILSRGLSDYHILNNEIFVASRFAIVQNAAAAALFLIFLLIQRKLKAKGVKCYERANEKRDS